eukprot:5642147-Prymnesium_polylepis.2
MTTVCELASPRATYVAPSCVCSSGASGSLVLSSVAVTRWPKSCAAPPGCSVAPVAATPRASSPSSGASMETTVDSAFLVWQSRRCQK